MNQKPYDEDTEYQLNEDESLYPAGDEESSDAEDAVSVPEEAPAAALTFSKRKAVYTVIFVILMALVVYKVFTLFFGTEQPATSKKSPVTKTVLSASQMSAMQATVKPVEKIAVTPVEEKPVVKVSVKPVVTDDEELKKLQQGYASIATDLQEQHTTTQGHFDELKQKISTLETSLDSLQTSINALTTQMQRNQAMRKSVVHRYARVSQNRARRVRKQKSYFVTAVIPGRAWLKGIDGSAITITVGDKLPGYGSVRAIDAYSGVVSTSSGVKIRYAINN